MYLSKYEVILPQKSPTLTTEQSKLINGTIPEGEEFVASKFMVDKKFRPLDQLGLGHKQFRKTQRFFACVTFMMFALLIGACILYYKQRPANDLNSLAFYQRLGLTNVNKTHSVCFQ